MISTLLAIELLKAFPDKIDWLELSRMSTAGELMKKCPDKINWWMCSMNPNAIELLKENQDKLSWFMLSKNPSLFTYEATKERPFTEELMQQVFHPH